MHAKSHHSPQPPHNSQQRQDTMSIAEKIAHTAETFWGNVKKMAGRVTGSRRLRTEGRIDQAKGALKQAGAKVKDATGH